MPTQPKHKTPFLKGLYKTDFILTYTELKQLWLRQQEDIRNKKTVYYGKQKKDSLIEYHPDIFNLML